MPDEDKASDLSTQKAQAFKENLIRIVTVFAYASSVSMAALCLSSYYVFFWEPKPPGPGPPVIVPHANAYMAGEPYPPLKLVGQPPGEEEKEGASFWQSVWSYIHPGDSTTLPPTSVTFTTTKRYSTTPIEPYNFTALMSGENNSSPGYPSVNISDILSIPVQANAENEDHLLQHDELEAEHEDDADDSREVYEKNRKKMMSGYLGIIPDRPKRGMKTIHVEEDLLPNVREVNIEDEELETDEESRDAKEENEYFEEGIKQKEEIKEYDSTKSGPRVIIPVNLEKVVTGKVVKDTEILVTTTNLMEGKPNRVDKEAKIETRVTKELERDANENITEVKKNGNRESTSTTRPEEKHEIIEQDETNPKLHENRYDINNNGNRRLESMLLGEHVSETERILSKMDNLTTNPTMSAVTTSTMGTQSTTFKTLNTISSMITQTQKVEHKRELGTPSTMIQAKEEIFTEEKITTLEVRHENKEDTMTTLTPTENAKQGNMLTTNSDIMATTYHNKLTKAQILDHTIQENTLTTVSDIKETVQMEVVALGQTGQKSTLGIDLKTKDDKIIGGEEHTTKPSMKHSAEIENITVIGHKEENNTSTKQETDKDVNDSVNTDLKTTEEADNNDNGQDLTTELDLEQITSQGDRMRPDFTQYQHHQRLLRPRKKFPSA